MANYAINIICFAVLIVVEIKNIYCSYFVISDRTNLVMCYSVGALYIVLYMFIHLS